MNISAEFEREKDGRWVARIQALSEAWPPRIEAVRWIRLTNAARARAKQALAMYEQMVERVKALK